MKLANDGGFILDDRQQALLEAIHRSPDFGLIEGLFDAERQWLTDQMMTCSENELASVRCKIMAVNQLLARIVKSASRP